MSAGVAAIILAAQPLLTAAIAAFWLGEKPSAQQWSGVAIGLVGVALIVWHKLDIAAVSAASLAAVAIGLATLTAGTLYQRKFCATADLRSSTLIQFVVSLLVLAPVSVIVEGAVVRWSWTLLAAITFLVVFASILAVNALHTLMRRGEATRVSSMLYLPPVVAVTLEWMFFDVVPTFVSLIGIAVTAIGVALAARKS
jgi:drug/metabolite transporter (DMT)-like permease